MTSSRSETCSVDGCAKPSSRGHSMCSAHRTRIYRHGSTDGFSSRLLAPPGASIGRKLLAGIASDADCWIWGRATVGGYGYLNIGGRRYGRAHVLMWELINQRTVPPGMYVCHSCDSPACINPSHLWLGTPADNVQDMHDKGRHPLGSAGRECSVIGCDGRHKARGYCDRHYWHLVRKGS